MHTPRKGSQHWFEKAEGPPNDAEILFFTLITIRTASSVKELDAWASEVLLEEAPLRALGPESWRPPAGADWQPRGRSAPEIYAPVRDAYKGTWEHDWLDGIGAAMAAWDGPGRVYGLQNTQLRHHRTKKLPHGPPGPRVDPRRAGPPRWQSSAIVQIASLVKRSGVELRRLLGRGLQLEDLPSPAEEVEELATRVEELEGQVAAEQKARRLLADAIRKRKARAASAREGLQGLRAALRKGVAGKVAAAKAAAKTKFEEKLADAVIRRVKARLDWVEGEGERMAEQVQRARARARAVEAQACLAGKRLVRLEAAEGRARCLKRQLDELRSEKKVLTAELLHADTSSPDLVSDSGSDDGAESEVEEIDLTTPPSKLRRTAGVPTHHPAHHPCTHQPAHQPAHPPCLEPAHPPAPAQSTIYLRTKSRGTQS